MERSISYRDWVILLILVLIIVTQISSSSLGFTKSDNNSDHPYKFVNANSPLLYSCIIAILSIFSSRNPIMVKGGNWFSYYLGIRVNKFAVIEHWSASYPFSLYTSGNKQYNKKGI